MRKRYRPGLRRSPTGRGRSAPRVVRQRRDGDESEGDGRNSIACSLEEGVAGVGRVGAPGGDRRWVGRGSGGAGRGLRRAHLGLHRGPVVREDETFEHLEFVCCVVLVMERRECVWCRRAEMDRERESRRS